MIDLNVRLSIKASDHQLYVLTDFFPAVAPVPVISDWLADSGSQCPLRSCEFEGEDEVVDLIELRTQTPYLRNYILEADNISSEMLLYLRIRFYLHSLSTDLTVEFLIDQLTHQLLAGLAPSDVVLNSLEEANVGCSSPHENGGVYFPKVEAAEEEALLLGDVVHSSNPDHEQEFAYS